MIFKIIEEFVWRYRRLVALLIIVIAINFLELALLYYKYDMFIGGFLQPFSYQTLSERLIFFIASFWFDLIFFGFISFIWFYIVDRLNKHGMYIYYTFTVLTLLIMGGWLGLKFKVLSYFNDTLNFLIIQNLAGGSIRDAFLYASNEITLFSGIVFIIIILFFISSKLLKKFNYVRSFPRGEKEHTNLFWVVMLGLFLTPMITFFVSNNESLRYGMKKKTSYYLISNLLDKFSDVDFDGFGIFTFPKDKQIFNAKVYPGALDIPANGIDEDGFLGDADFPNSEVDRLTEIIPNKGKHIILIVLESARADLMEKKVMGAYISPEIKRLASKGFFVKNAYSHTGYTTTSIKAIFNRSLIDNNSKLSLLNFLQTAGYQISIISGQDESFGDVAVDVGMKNKEIYYFDARTAIDDRVFVSKESSSLRLSEERVVEQFRLRISELDFTTPQFIYLNFQAAHFPYSHPKMTKRSAQNLISRSEINIENKLKVAETYWNAIANADWAVGEVINELKQHHVLDNTTVAILGDHGESLFDDMFLGHGHAINDSQTRIPLVFNDPNIVVNEVIGQTDVAEMLIRSALSLENNWTKKDKVVFQLVGNLNRPALIAHVQNSGHRTLLDFRSEQVYFSDLQLWEGVNEALTNPLYKHRVEHLIRDWESLRWQTFLARKKGRKEREKQ